MRALVVPRGTWLAGGLVAAAALTAWAVLLARRDEMPMAAGFWLLAWTTMMAAMMLPSASPLVLLYARRGQGLASSAFLVSGYLLAWTAVGLPAYALDMRLPDPHDAVVAAVLAATGVYQVTPLKGACLRQCRSPLAFLLTHWRTGRFGALRVGIEHGAYCVGCCWALMVVLVVAGSMGLVWVAAIAAAVAAEKLLPAGQLIGRLGGLALVAAGIAVAI
jgi:predicted metal-binding membrane protein